MLLEADGTKEIFSPLACISCRLSYFFKTQQIICQVVVRRAMDFIWNPKPGPGILLVRRGGLPSSMGMLLSPHTKVRRRDFDY